MIAAAFRVCARVRITQYARVRHSTTPARWCHLTWSTARRHKFFNIAALARFCERTLVGVCERNGWRGEAAVAPDRIHVLVEAPGSVTRDHLVLAFRSAATSLARDVGIATRTQEVWEESCWCSVVTNGPAVEAVRRRLRSINTPAATSRP
jgi:REP element-mobilizing transposase RayT